jgi:hypothetical protein
MSLFFSVIGIVAERGDAFVPALETSIRRQRRSRVWQLLRKKSKPEPDDNICMVLLLHYAPR